MKYVMEPTKWMWTPHDDRYQEWEGDMSHPEVAMDLWGLSPEEFSGMWGGFHHPNGHTEIGWYPHDYPDERFAKQNAPIELLEHLRKRRLNR